MKRLFVILFVFGVLFAALGNAYAINYSYTYLDIPGQAVDMNDNGKIVGSYIESPSPDPRYINVKGFIFSDSSWVSFDAPDPLMMFFNVRAINNMDQIAGDYASDLGDRWGFSFQNGIYHNVVYDIHNWVLDVNDLGIMVGHHRWGFSYDGTDFTDLYPPENAYPWESPSFSPCRINNQNLIIGSISGTCGLDYFHSFPTSGWYSVNGSTWKNLDYPGATSTTVWDLNNLGVIVGQYTDSYGKIHAFRYNGTSWTSGNYPGAIETVAYGINDKGVIIGTYRDGNGKNHGYSFVNGVWSRIDYPGATGTTANLINNSGWIVGSFTKDGQEAQFLAKPITTVKIDIKPNNSYNYINYRDAGTVSVAVLGSYSFRPFNVLDKTSLTFGRTGDEASLLSCSTTPYDVNHDGYTDLICRFSIPRAGFTCGNTSGTLKGQKTDGNPIEGKSYVRIVGCY